MIIDMMGQVVKDGVRVGDIKAGVFVPSARAYEVALTVSDLREIANHADLYVWSGEWRNPY